jgi:cation diffusion facilitator CzcD-associated flavoprotein CzcO
MYLNTRVTAATFNSTTDKWSITCRRPNSSAFTLTARFFVPCIGFAAKRHIPDWPGIDSFQGEIYHSSFWPKKVDVKGKHVAVIGNGATGVQIAQECAKEVGPDGSLTCFIRTPNIALAMQQAKISPEQIEADRSKMGEMLKQRLETAGGFHWHGLDEPIRNYTPEQREEMFEEMWRLGGFRILTTFNDILLDEECNRHTYDFWARKVRARLHDEKVKDILAPLGGHSLCYYAMHVLTVICRTTTPLRRQTPLFRARLLRSIQQTQCPRHLHPRCHQPHHSHRADWHPHSRRHPPPRGHNRARYGLRLRQRRHEGHFHHRAEQPYITGSLG